MATTVAALIAGGTFAAGAEARWPQDGWSWITPRSQAYVRTCASTGCQAIMTLPPGYPVGMLCYAEGQWAPGMWWSNIWIKVYVQGNDFYNQGFVNSSMLVHQSWTPHC